MARRFVQLAAALLFVAVTSPAHGSEASGNGGDTTQFTVATNKVGSEFFAYGQLTVHRLGGDRTYTLPIGHRSVSCYYSSWHLLRILPDGSRRYDVDIWDGCTDQQLFPGQSPNCTSGLDYQGDTIPSECVTLPRGTAPAGYPPATCSGLSETSAYLGVSANPAIYDTSKGVHLVAQTNFAQGFLAALSDGTCTNIINWDVMAWRFDWPDNSSGTAPGSGQQGTTAAHDITPQSEVPSTQIARVDAVAHVHVQGRAVDFNAAGNPTVVTVDTFVDVSNDAAATGLGAQPTYTAPTLVVGAVGQSQNGLGGFGARSAAPTTHLEAIRGHLLYVFPDAIVVRPGTEVVAGVVTGTSSTKTINWSYRGGPTDTPLGTSVPSGGFVVQWNHAERLDGLGQPVDESIPLTVTAETTYPDGHVITGTISGVVRVTIYYVASTSS